MSGERRRLALNPQALLACLVGHRVEFVVIGGFSVDAHGLVGNWVLRASMAGST
jgi:hypothetical protein